MRAGRRVAVVGGGVAGLAAGYLLNRRHEVCLFEKSGRIGGNAYTHTTPYGETPDIAVAAFGRAGYKNFYALLEELDIDTEPCYSSYMSFHDMDTRDGLYITPSLKRSLTQRFRLFSPGNLWNLVRLFIGLRKGRRLLDDGLAGDLTMGECLERIPEMTGESRVVFLCALCLLSSMEADEVLRAPAAFFLEKLAVHHDVVSPEAAYSVRCVRGGTRTYVNALAAGYRKRIILNSKIRTVRRREVGVELVMDDGSRKAFDDVVFACNPDQALALLERPTEDERRLLGAWKYKEGRVVVHRDCSSFPPRDLIESYTFLYSNRDGRLSVSVNGALWHEPHVSPDCEYLSSQHPNFPIRRDLIDLEASLRTPVFDSASCATRRRLPSLNGAARSYFCGSYFGFGLHEDAVASAMAAAEHFR